jgi:glycosyltransferase involved in cell wall biosynthesis
VKFTIVTPSFRNSAWLKLCIASVADQSDVEVEHIVQDACSDDETRDWLPHDPRVKVFIEKDAGMYDAVNRGFRRASGNLVAYLNCDEQYLPGALKIVHDFFVAHPEVEVVFSDSIVIDPDGNYICHRPSLIPGKHSIWVRFPVLTCAVFIRRSVVEERGLYFDTQWRDLGDYWWIREMVLHGVRMAVLPRLTSVFTETGHNMNLKPNALRERRVKWELAPGWVKFCKYFFIVQHRLRLAIRPAVMLKPFDYSLYTRTSPAQRVTRRAEHPTSFWKGRLTLNSLVNPF